MRVLVISDIHANYTAFETVIEDAGKFDAVWCLGDVVGYGPDPNACVELLSEQPNLACVLGNHDVAALGRMPLESFNGDARRSLLWQERVLSADSIEFLETLPQEAMGGEHVTLVHGSPRDPVWEYILNTLSARLNFDAFETDFCFVGHTHVQSMFHMDLERDRVSLDIPRVGLPVELSGRAILNPGSVGQPRDRDPRAAYAIFDTEALTWAPQRVEYDIPSVQARIREAKLPEKHALRLADGW
ncbi:MAG: metallophosphoesterase family protein [Anaerolineae bacterium]|jgi:predicted phosphodiesterase|nr:metallophosphoesterase family protein [Anaerolineae bacterium]MBT7071843.1 metallophosphoesterase family protein [Anaerolineae bacterium]MBT7325008.1 metallophosphoesterase family protein [Anaerolineae bacterium]